MDLHMIEKYFFGYADVEEIDGYYVLRRFNKEQMQYYVEQDYVSNSKYPAGVVLRAKNCDKIQFDVKCFGFSQFNKEKKYVIDVISDNELIISKGFPGETQGFSFNFGNKEVVLNFPYDAEIGIKNIVVVGEENPPCGTALCFGDSITQGFMTHSHSHSYPSVLARELNLDVHNFGIGGFHFERGILRGIEEYGKPEFISVAYGTNDWNFEENYEEEIQIIFKTLNEKYPEIPVFVILPLPRKTEKDVKKSGVLEDVRIRIKEEAEKYKNFNVLRFTDEIEVERDLCEDFIHPNDEGMKRFAKLVLDEIKQKL
ncbi:MAG: SGNH/GDSL hydrolase family protein [Clostridia bacterium]|nr:SGNH/GDSL hydrolase family protein [Clostridia bacterium]